MNFSHRVAAVDRCYNLLELFAKCMVFFLYVYVLGKKIHLKPLVTKDSENSQKLKQKTKIKTRIFLDKPTN